MTKIKEQGSTFLETCKQTTISVIAQNGKNILAGVRSSPKGQPNVITEVLPFGHYENAGIESDVRSDETM